MEKDEEQQFLELLEGQSGLSGVRITILYDKTLQQITGRESDPMYLSRGSLFPYVLMGVFESYPAIPEKYPAGVLGFMRNGGSLMPALPMQDGDVVLFVVER